MTQHWNASDDCLEIYSMPFYWRLSDEPQSYPGIASRLPIRVTADADCDYLKFVPSSSEWAAMDMAYRQNANIGFLNPDSGQMSTYGSSVNKFFLRELTRFSPKEQIVEIGCGAGFSIQFLKKYGFDVLGVDPSEYSLRWSERLGFRIENDFFREGLFETPPDFIYCNDVFEHIPDVQSFAQTVCDSLTDGGVFCFATTNSTQSIALGDISMLEHQHVNMFTDRSIELILRRAGFTDITIGKGSYGNTFHVTAVKRSFDNYLVNEPVRGNRGSLCEGFFLRAANRIRSFAEFYDQGSTPMCYVPLRAVPYLACVGDYGHARVFDSNVAWRHKFIDGYQSPIEGVDDIFFEPEQRFFIASLTFFKEIKATLLSKGFPEAAINSIDNLP